MDDSHRHLGKHGNTRGTAAQCLVFLLDGAEYGVTLDKISSLHSSAAIGAAPGSRDLIAGTVRVEGFELPVLDLRVMLGLAANGPPEDIVMLDLAGRGVGLAVDRIVDVLPLEAVSGASAAAFATTTTHRPVRTEGASGRLLHLVDVDALLFQSRPSTGGQLAA